MKETILAPAVTLQDYVKQLFVIERQCAPDETISIPFFADGCPGIMFHTAENGIYQLPRNKKLAELILYGQTLLPMELSVQGPFRMVVFQLFPFAARSLIGVNPKTLNDDCYDLHGMENQDIPELLKKLGKTSDTEGQIALMTTFLETLIAANAANPDTIIRLAVNLILESKGKVAIKSIREKLPVTERTFERLFVAQIGVTPKQFAKIVQFQCSLHQLSDSDYAQLSDVVFENGFADQSHFIRTFKQFTGKTPTEFRK